MKRFLIKLSVFITIVLVIYNFCPPISSSKGRTEGDCNNIQETSTCPWCGSCADELLESNTNNHGTTTFSDGSIYTGQFKNGKPNGHGVLTSPYGSTYEGEFLDGQPHGMGTKTHLNGIKYVGQFKNGEPNGKGKLISYGTMYDGEFLDGKPNGKGTKTFSNGGIYIGHWKQGKKHGFGIEKHQAKNAKSGYWNHGRYIGIENPQINI